MNSHSNLQTRKVYSSVYVNGDRLDWPRGFIDEIIIVQMRDRTTLTYYEYDITLTESRKSKYFYFIRMSGTNREKLQKNRWQITATFQPMRACSCGDLPRRFEDKKSFQGHSEWLKRCTSKIFQQTGCFASNFRSCKRVGLWVWHLLVLIFESDLQRGFREKLK